MLKIKDLTVHVWENTILQDINITFQKGKNYCILGKNGSGKSSLAMSIIGHPSYQILSGQILLEIDKDRWDRLPDSIKEKVSELVVWDEDDQIQIDITHCDPNIRSKLWVFVAFQNIPEIKGIKLFEFLRQIYNENFGTNETFVSFKKIIEPIMVELDIDKEFLWRDLNVWFSGWEKRKIEILQLRLLQPEYIFLDEIDSGLDIDALRNVTKLLHQHNQDSNALIFITHYFDILENLGIDQTVVIKKGQVIKTWGKEIIDEIKLWWYEARSA